MKRWFTTVTMISLLVLLLPAPGAAEIETKLDFSAGYRVDELDWNMAGYYFYYEDDTEKYRNVNVLSELTWEDITIYQGVFSFDALANQCVAFQASIGYGKVMDGKNQDSDYKENDRTGEFSRSNNSADDGHVSDWSVAIGYRFRPGQGRYTITPLFGYSEHKQSLTMSDGFQTIASSEDDTPDYGSFTGLNSSYEAKWDGMWAGAEMSFLIREKLSLFGRVEYHVANYYAQADWNLRDEFDHPKSFTHETDGTGLVLSGGCDYIANNQFSIGARITYQKWSTDSGTDTLYIDKMETSPDVWEDIPVTPVSTWTTLNEVNWSSYSVMLKLTYTFPKEEEF